MADSVIAALKQVLELEPMNLAIRTMLVEKLLDAGHGLEALTHCQTALASEPDSGPWLALASKAALLAGNESLSNRYRTIADSLGKVRSEKLMADVGFGPETTSIDSEISSREIDQSNDTGPEEPTRNDSAFTERSVERGEGPDGFWVERPSISLSDVVGMTAAKRAIELSFLAPLRRPDLSKQFGLQARGGLMLFGPPGCGKTYIARALAGELAAGFLPVRIDMILGPYVGQSERNMHAIMEYARKCAPCVVFFDELDALGHKRSNLEGSATRTLANQLLSEMDGAQFENEGVFFLGATNHPWDVDPAFRRPGRFDHSLLVLPPDKIARRGILENLLRDKPVEPVNVDQLANQTEGFSAADLNLAVRNAASSAFESSLQSGTPGIITAKQIQASFKEARPSTRGWFESARNYAIYSNQDGSMDELLGYLKQQKML